MAVDKEAPTEREVLSGTAIRRIELIWPGKDLALSARQQDDGRWILEPQAGTKRLMPLVDLETIEADGGVQGSLAVVGDRIAALESLRRGFAGQVRLAYLDLPRIDLDDKSLAFQGEGEGKWATWLTVVDECLRAVKPLMRRDGVVILHCGDVEEPYARALATDAAFAREDHVATIVWQRHYAPRNMKGMKEFTATHDPLLVYAVDKEVLPAVGLRQTPEGYTNPDEDPRGPWKAEHKGARTYRANSDFDAFVPPYRWRLADGRLPEGLWRISPLTGVVWGIPEEVGVFPVTVEVEDSAGGRARAKLQISVVPEGASASPGEVPWLLDEATAGGRLKVATKELPLAVLRQEYSAILLASGGEPHRDRPRRPGSGRYWEFARDTLVRAYLRDGVSLGRDGGAIPHPKAYVRDVGDMQIKNQMTWWPGRNKGGPDDAAFVGYTEDATKHLKKLRELGRITTAVTSAKPERLLARLLDIFTDRGDVVLEVFAGPGDLAATAVKLHRRFLMLSGASEGDRKTFDECAIPRLRAVVQGLDRDLEQIEGEIRVRSDDYIPFAGGGAFTYARLGDWVVERNRDEDLPTINRKAYPSGPSQREAILTAEGYMPIIGRSVDGVAWNGRAAAIVLPAEDFLTAQLAAELVSNLAEEYERLTVYYYRSAEEFEPDLTDGSVAFKRVPVELGV